MLTLFNLLLEQLKKVEDQKDQSVSLVVILCLFLSFALVIVVALMAPSRLLLSDPYAIPSPSPTNVLGGKR